VDIFYSHRFDPDTPLEETMAALARAVTSGKALYAGISNYGPERTREAVKLLRAMGTPCLIHQTQYSMFRRGPEQGLLDALGAEGVGCIAFSPLAQGLLTDRYLGGVPGDSRAAKSVGFLKRSDLAEEILARARALNELARERGQTLAQMALAWVLRDSRMTSALVGASKVEQIEQNLAALGNLAFSEDELRRIESILAREAAS
jgi:L-glyceraldehyde 3-phosphate reductase